MTKKQKVAKVAAFLEARENGKAEYARADDLLEELVGLLEVGETVTLPDGREIALVDQFADRAVVWKPAGVRRFELKELKHAG